MQIKTSRMHSKTSMIDAKYVVEFHISKEALWLSQLDDRLSSKRACMCYLHGTTGNLNQGGPKEALWWTINPMTLSGKRSWMCYLWCCQRSTYNGLSQELSYIAYLSVGSWAFHRLPLWIPFVGSMCWEVVIPNTMGILLESNGHLHINTCVWATRARPRET